jgi:hypothetical protein
VIHNIKRCADANLQLAGRKEKGREKPEKESAKDNVLVSKF